MEVKIYIARHGQNEDNRNGILNGRRDLPLTELGRQQARELGLGIGDVGLKFDAVYCSPLQRAHETAEIVCKVTDAKVEPVILAELVERDFGVMTGRRTGEILEMCNPDVIITDTINYFLNPEGAETFPELIERGQRVLNTIYAQQSSGNVLLITHGDIGKMIYTAATGRNWEDVLRNFHFGNCDLIEVSPNDKAHVIQLPQHNH